MGRGKSEKPHKDGKIDGVFTLWHKNGQKKSQGFYLNGQQDCRFTFWYENGIATVWSEGGKKVLEKNFIHGKEQ